MSVLNVWHTLVTCRAVKAWGAVTWPGHRVAELVRLGALADLVTVLPKCTWKTSWCGDTDGSHVHFLFSNDTGVALEGPAVLTLFAAISCEPRRTATLPGDVVAGLAVRTSAALHAVLPKHAWPTSWKGNSRTCLYQPVFCKLPFQSFMLLVRCRTVPGPVRQIKSDQNLKSLKSKQTSYFLDLIRRTNGWSIRVKTGSRYFEIWPWNGNGSEQSMSVRVKDGTDRKSVV